MCELRWGSGVQAEVGLWAAQAISRIYLTHSRSLSMVGQVAATTKRLCAPRQVALRLLSPLW